MRWLTLWLCVILAGQHALAQETLTNDPRLQTRITVWLKMEPLRDTLRAISKQTGVPLRCQDAIQHHKVSVFVEDRPAGEILTQLAALFRYAWRRDGGEYVLYVPDETRQQEEGVLRAAREARVRALQDVIRFAREAVKNPPVAGEAEGSSSWAYSTPSDDASPETSNRRLVYMYRPWTALRTYSKPQSDGWWLFNEATLLALLAKMPQQAEQALLNGQLVGFSTQPMPGVYRMPEMIEAPSSLRGYEVYEETVDGEQRYRTRLAQKNPDFWGVWMRLSMGGNYLECELVGFSQNTFLSTNRLSTELTLHRLPTLLVFYTDPYARDHAWIASWRTWATPPKEWEARVPERALAQRADRPKPSFEPYQTGEHLLNSADLMEWFAWSTRLPVIAESFRIDNLHRSEVDLNAPRSVLHALSQQSWLRIDESGYVLRRVQWYWGKRLVELPEDWLRPLEQRFAQKRWLDLDDYITLAARLTERQASYYEALNSGYVIYDRLNPAIRFPFVTVIHNLRGLRFLAALSASQRQRLLRGEWIPTETLTLPQRQRFEEALGERFPPPERLMVINFPYRFIDDARMQALGSAPQTSTADLPPVERAAFRLEFAPEKPLRYEIRRPSGATAYLSPSDVRIQIPDSGDLPPDFAEEIRTTLRRLFAELLLKWLNEEPGSQLYLARTQGYTLELQAPPARRKTYYIFQRRAEPVDVRTLEAKLKELEKSDEGTQANRP